ncbi:MAG: hypothetical protein ACRDKB_00720 [Actinomycetota bacterium]
MSHRKVIAVLVAAVLIGALVQAGPAQARDKRKKNKSRPAPAAPANDNFAAAKEVSKTPFETSLDNSAATVEFGEPQGCGSATNTVWFSFKPAADADLVAQAVADRFNTALTVYVGDALGSLEQIGCAGGTSTTSEVAFYGFGQETYYFQVGGSNGSAGTIGFKLLRGEAPGVLLGKPGSVPHGWKERVLLEPTTVEYKSDGVDLITFDGRPNPVDPKLYDIDITVAGQALPQINVFTDGRVKDEHHYSAIGPSHSYVTVGMRVRYDTRGQQCVLGVGGECKLLLPNVPSSEDVVSARAYRAELIVDLRLERQAGVAAIPLIEQTVRIPLAGYVAALLP